MPFSAQSIKAARLHLMRSEPTMKAIVKRVGPCQIKTKRDRFLTLASSIISQQISGAAARTIWGRLEDAVKPHKISAESLSGFDLESLRELGVSRQKAGYLCDLRDKTLNGEVEFKRLSKMTDEEVIDNLTQIKGIGRWTAQMFLMFSLCRPDIFPMDDLGIRNAIKLNYNLKKDPPTKKMLKIAEPWRPHATIASWYLWQSLDV